MLKIPERRQTAGLGRCFHLLHHSQMSASFFSATTCSWRVSGKPKDNPKPLGVRFLQTDEPRTWNLKTHSFFRETLLLWHFLASMLTRQLKKRSWAAFCVSVSTACAAFVLRSNPENSEAATSHEKKGPFLSVDKTKPNPSKAKQSKNENSVGSHRDS